MIGLEHLNGESTMVTAFRATLADQPNAVALRDATGSARLTWAECRAQVERLAGGLAALGVGACDTVALMLRNSPQLFLLDTAAQHLGAVPWSVYLTSSPEQIRFQLAGAGTRVVVGESDLLPRLAAALPGTDVVHVISADDLHALPAPPRGFDPEAAATSVRADWPLTIIWTSGTTDEPKPVQLSHGGMIAMLRGYAQLSELPPGGRGVSYLPSAHVADRFNALYWWAMAGIEITCVADGAGIAQVLPAVRPTMFGSVPRVWEKLRAALEAQGITDPGAMPGPATAAVREKLGLDRAGLLIVGAAPLAVETLHYFDALGLPIRELWGMSESSGILTAMPPSAPRYGSVGQPLPDVRLQIADDGEVLARGPQLMLGYRGRPDLTEQKVIDGWLHTDDIGAIDEDGYLRIIGRKKELIINSAGKNMSPLGIEGVLTEAGPLIGEACVIGDRRPYNVALLVLDPDNARAWARRHERPDSDLADLVADARLRAEVDAALTQANERLSRVEQVKRWCLLAAEWLPDSDELTPTMKLKRRVIADKYACEIEQLHS